MMHQLFKFCPNCGSQNHSFTENKRFLCNDCSFDYYHNTAAACAVILLFEGKILFTIRNQEPCLGALDLPGGFIEAGESLEQGLRREVQEELGIELPHLQFMTSFPNTYPHKATIYTTCDAVFVAQLAALPLSFQRDEIQEIVLLDPRSIDLESIPFSSIRNAVRYFIESY